MTKPQKGVGQYMSEAWQVYRENFSLLIGYVAWMLIPFAVMVLMDIFYSDPYAGPYIGVNLIATIASIVLSLWVSIVLMRLTKDLLERRKPETNKISQTSWALIWPVFWIGVVVGLIQIGGFILLIIPGIIFAVWFALTQYAVVLDAKRGWAAATFSHDLVRGRFWSALWRLLVGPALIGIVIYIIVGAIVAIIGLLTGSFDAEGPVIWVEIISTIAAYATIPFFVAYATNAYLDFRATK